MFTRLRLTKAFCLETHDQCSSLAAVWHSAFFKSVPGLDKTWQLSTYCTVWESIQPRWSIEEAHYGKVGVWWIKISPSTIYSHLCSTEACYLLVKLTTKRFLAPFGILPGLMHAVNVKEKWLVIRTSYSVSVHTKVCSTDRYVQYFTLKCSITLSLACLKM